jgi:hypothetical protein
MEQGTIRARRLNGPWRRRRRYRSHDAKRNVKDNGGSCMRESRDIDLSTRSCRTRTGSFESLQRSNNLFTDVLSSG